MLLPSVSSSTFGFLWNLVWVLNPKTRKQTPVPKFKCILDTEIAKKKGTTECLEIVQILLLCIKIISAKINTRSQTSPVVYLLKTLDLESELASRNTSIWVDIKVSDPKELFFYRTETNSISRDQIHLFLPAND